METNSVSSFSIFFFLVFLVIGFEVINCSVTYDNKAIIINGQRRILLSGSIHYPRSTPDVIILSHSCFLNFLFSFSGEFMKNLGLQMWEDLILKAKNGGLDVIDTYVFWNGHEPSPGNVSCSKFLNYIS